MMKTKDDVKTILNKYRNAWYNSADKDQVEVAMAIDRLFALERLNEMLIAESWLTFEEVKKDAKFKAKTKVFRVISKSDGSLLGQIRWHGAYRRYAFFVTSEVTVDNEKWGFTTWTPDTKIFDIGCMMEIVEFIRELMKQRRLEKEARKAAAFSTQFVAVIHSPLIMAKEPILYYDVEESDTGKKDENSEE